MKFYLAPMEGITGQVYRNVYHSFYNNIDKYFTPFIAPNKKRIMRTREQKDVAPENNLGMYVVPQILTNQPEQFCDTCGALYELGYREVNLNAGCPSSTVVTKKKGAGILAEPEILDRFLDEVFTVLRQRGIEESIVISVKTRLGIFSQAEFSDILAVYNRYPLGEVIVHPRVQQDFYKNTPDWEAFREALEQSVHPLCYNGDIFTKEQYEAFVAEFPKVERMMLGRGVIANPGLIGEIKGEEKISFGQLKHYHDLLYKGYTMDLKNERDVLFKMKELWFYIGNRFEEGDRDLKKIRKAKSALEYEGAVESLFAKEKK